MDAFANLYAVWSDNSNIFYSFSTDLGATWSPALRVNSGATVGKANVFPWVDADANGHVVVAWFGGDRAGDSNSRAIHEPCLADQSTTCMTLWTNWNTYVAESVNGHDPAPEFVQSVASDHVIHRGTVSTGGLGGGANRNLADLFQVAFDPLHRANLAFSDDHKLSPLTIAGHTGNDVPQARRLIRANFTHQLQPAAGIQTASQCAEAVEVAPDADGSGTLDPVSDFAFIANSRPLNGALRFRDRGSGLEVRSSTGITSLAFNGSCGLFAGNAKLNGQAGYSFRVTACDVATPGAGKDTFFIDVTRPNFTYSKGGVIATGEIRKRP